MVLDENIVSASVQVEVVAAAPARRLVALCFDNVPNQAAKTAFVGPVEVTTSSNGGNAVPALMQHIQLL